MNEVKLTVTKLNVALAGDAVAIDFGPICRLLGLQGGLQDHPDVAKQLLAPLTRGDIVVTITEEMLTARQACVVPASPAERPGPGV